MKKFYFIILIGTFLFNTPSFGLIINEVLSNEPGGISNTHLEWIELYNEQSATVSLSGYEISLSNGSFLLPDSVSIAAGEYYIICHRLFAIDTSSGFETIWGDASGVWGDSPYESSLQKPYEAIFNPLRNIPETMVLLENNVVVSGLVWSSAGIDGYTWERVISDADLILQSYDEGGTPGRVNTVTPVPFDLAIDSVSVFFIDGTSQINYHISNRGIYNITGAVINLLENNQSLDIIDIGSLNSAQSTTITSEYSFFGLYVSLTAQLSQDDRLTNNQIDFTAAGSDYPPLIINELMANPSGDVNTEWLELKNVSNLIVDLSSWKLGDLVNLYPISDTSIMMGPGDYFILAETRDNFLNFYFEFNGTIIEPPQWSTFNNTGDKVRLVDEYDIEADRFVYDSSLADSYTWSKSEDALYDFSWGRSLDEYGTPGRTNTVFFMPTGSELEISINPTHFSPDGDGFEDEVSITLNLPEADNYTVKIYDRYGRIVKTFYDKIPTLMDEFIIEWNGLSDSGERLPIGIYILYVEGDGAVSKKETLVIAR